MIYNVFDNDKHPLTVIEAATPCAAAHQFFVQNPAVHSLWIGETGAHARWYYMPDRHPTFQDKPTVDYQTFGARLKEARNATGRTQAQTAALVGIPQPRWAEYEAGVVLPPLLRLLHFIAILELDPAILFPEFFTTRKQPRSAESRSPAPTSNKRRHPRPKPPALS
jgi:transcriptional regulator with XRE-family HTH domain